MEVKQVTEGQPLIKPRDIIFCIYAHIIFPFIFLLMEMLTFSDFSFIFIVFKSQHFMAFLFSASYEYVQKNISMLLIFDLQCLY